MPSKSRSTKSATPNRPPQTPSTQPDAILVGKLQALLAELDIKSGEALAAAMLAQDSTAAILAAIEQSKTSMLVSIDRLTEECNLMRISTK